MSVWPPTYSNRFTCSAHARMRRRVEMMQQLCENALPKTARAQCDATRRRSDADEPLGGPIHPLRTSLGPPCIISPTHTANLYLWPSAAAPTHAYSAMHRARSEVQWHSKGCRSTRAWISRCNSGRGYDAAKDSICSPNERCSPEMVSLY